MENCRIKHGGLRILSLLIAGAVLMTAPISAWAKHLGGNSGHGTGYTSVKVEDVRNTLHNLSTSNPISGINIGSLGTGTTEVCVFCHTPHGADTANDSAPLWNRAVAATGTGYTPYTGPNFDGSVAGNQPVGVSLACLSCHDGVAAMDALINSPGSGGFRAQVVGLGTSAGLLSKPGTSAFLDTDLSMGNGIRSDSGTNYTAFSTGAAPFPNLTEDLSDDHPISFPMDSTNPDPQFADVGVTSVGNIGLIARTGQGAPSDRRDQLRLYPVNGVTAAVTTRSNGWVECASCHNPHAPRPLFLRLPNGPSYSVKGGGAVSENDVIVAQGGTGGGTGSGFLIADNPNAGSAVCISCHEK